MLDAIFEWLKLNLLASFPQTFILLLLCFSLIEVKPTNLMKRVAILSIIHSLYTDAVILYLPFWIHIMNSVLTSFILIFFLFRELKLKLKIYLVIFFYIVILFFDIILVVMMTYVVGIQSHDNMRHENFLEMLMILYPLLVLAVLVTKFINKRNSLSLKTLFSNVLVGDRRKYTTVIALIVIQFFLLGALQAFQFSTDRFNKGLNITVILTTILVCLLTLIVLIRLLIRNKEQAIKQTQDVYLEEINNMFTSVRGQRHDFLNHVQVIRTMLQMGKVEQLKAYVAELVNETLEVNEIVHHASPVLAAFIRAKMTVALGRGISFTFELPDEWNIQESSIKIIDIIKITGNLVDNAFDETELLPASQRKVHTSIQMDHTTIKIEVSNSGRILNNQDLEKMMDRGYTTKGSNHSGLGLAIVLERIKHYNGTFSMESNGGMGTSFRLSLPHA